MKRIIRMILLSMVLLFSVLGVISPVISQAKEKQLAISKKNFPDKKLRKILLKKYDKDKDKFLSAKELKRLRKLSFSKGGKIDLKGLRRFPNLISLKVINCKVEHIDELAECRGITIIILKNNRLTGKLDLQNMPALQKLDCSQNHLQEISLLNTDLKQLSCKGNIGVNIYVPVLKEFKGLDDTAKIVEKGVPISKENFPDSNFRKYIRYSFDINGDGELSWNEIAAIKKLDVGETSDYQVGKELYGVTTLRGIRFFRWLEEIDCSSSQLYSLNVSYNSRLRILQCSHNELSELDLSENPQIEWVDCNQNEIRQIDVASCKNLTYLNCNDNRVSALNLKNNHMLCFLYCKNNQLVCGNCLTVGSQLKEYNVSGQKRTIKLKKKKGRYFLPVKGLGKTNPLKKLSKGKYTINGIRLGSKKPPKKITYKYNMFTDGKILTDVELTLSR